MEHILTFDELQEKITLNIEEEDVIVELSVPPTAAGEVLVQTRLRNEPILCSRVEVEFEESKKGLKHTLKSYVVAREERIGVYP